MRKSFFIDCSFGSGLRDQRTEFPLLFAHTRFSKLLRRLFGFSLLSLIDTLVNLYLVFIGLWVIDAIINTGLKLYQHSKLSSKLPLKGVCQAQNRGQRLGLDFRFVYLVGQVSLVLFLGPGCPDRGSASRLQGCDFGVGGGNSTLGQQHDSPRRLDRDAQIRCGWRRRRGILTTVKVQNFDKTITSIPAHALVSDAFKNWRGMSESGGRRIKRSIFIDISSIKFLDSVKLNELKKIDLLQEYLKAKLEEIGESNGSLKTNPP